MHNKIKYYLEENHNITLERNSECYYEEPIISFDCTQEEYDQISELKEFTVGQITYTKITPENKHYSEDRRNGGKCVYLKINYLDNDTYHSDITDGGNKKYGVIAPNGNFYECGYSGHNDLEYDLQSRGLIEKSPEYNKNSFEWFGWIKLTGASLTQCEFEFRMYISDYDYKTQVDTVLKENIVTVEQCKAIKDYIESLGRDKFLFCMDWYSIKDVYKLSEMNSINYHEKEFRDLHLERLTKDEANKELYKTKNDVELINEDDDV